MKYTRNFVRRRSRMTAFAAFSRYAGANSNAPVAGLNTKRPQASVRSGAAQLTLTISGAIDVSATSPCVSKGLNPAGRESTLIRQEGPGGKISTGALALPGDRIDPRPSGIRWLHSGPR